MRRFRRLAAVLVVAAAVSGCAEEAGQEADPASGAQTTQGASDAIERAIDALGGERVESVRNITLIGYGQYTHQYGGGGISAVPGIPLKIQQANELVRVYDIEHGRYRARERRNYLFPFAAYRGHDFVPVNQVLDGSVAYDVGADGEMRRIGSSVGVGADGPRERRMWMHANPVVAVLAARAAEDLGNARADDGLTLVDFTLPEGDPVTLALTRQTDLPAWVRWTGPHANLGQVEYTMHFTGYGRTGACGCRWASTRRSTGAASTT